MRKILKIIIVVFALLIIVGIASFSIVILDASTLATDTNPLPNGAAIGRAIVIYDPGLSGGAKDVATKIGYDLQEAGYNVIWQA